MTGTTISPLTLALQALAGSAAAGDDLYQLAADSLVRGLGGTAAQIVLLHEESKRLQTVAACYRNATAESSFGPAHHEAGATNDSAEEASRTSNSPSPRPWDALYAAPDATEPSLFTLEPPGSGAPYRTSRAALIFDANGRAIGHLATTHDTVTDDVPADREFFETITARVRGEFLRAAGRQLIGRSTPSDNSSISLVEQERLYRAVFDAVPISVRIDDLSRLRQMVDDLAISDSDEFADYLSAHPEFVEKCARSIKVVEANNTTLALYGYSNKDEFKATITQSFSSINLRAVRHALEVIHRRGTRLEFETAVVGANGEERNLMVRWTVPPGDEQFYARTLLTSVDITELRRTEQRLRQVQKMEAMGQLTGGVAHDFNNMLSIVQGNLEILSRTPYAEAPRAAISRAVQRGKEMTAHLLSFSREQALHPVQLNVASQLPEILAFLQRTLGTSLRIETAIASDIWHAYADPGPLETALLNLLLNARDATTYGGVIAVAAQNVRIDDRYDARDSELMPGNYVRIAVSDRGHGIARPTLDRVFEPFFTTKGPNQGSGLGLSMVYGFAKQTGGSTTIESTPGEGTTVSLFLPAVLVDDTSEDADNAGQRVDPEPTPCPMDPAADLSVLLVEDDDDLRQLLALMLETLGHEVVAVPQADLGFETFSAASFDLVISDVIVPGAFNGFELARRVRETSSVPVILISGYSNVPGADEVAKVAALTLYKPFQLDELTRAIEVAMATTTAQRP